MRYFCMVQCMYSLLVLTLPSSHVDFIVTSVVAVEIAVLDKTAFCSDQLMLNAEGLVRTLPSLHIDFVKTSLVAGENAV